jgi:hypothetical protein
VSESPKPALWRRRRKISNIDENASAKIAAKSGNGGGIESVASSSLAWRRRLKAALKMASALESGVSAARQHRTMAALAAKSHRQQWRRNGNQRWPSRHAENLRLS